MRAARGRAAHPARPSCSRARTSARTCSPSTSTGPTRSTVTRRWASLPPLAAELGVVLPLSIYERANRATYNSVVIVDADGDGARHLPQEPHPRRPGLHGEVLLQPWRHRLPGVGDASSARSASASAGTSGSPSRPAAWRCSAPTCCATRRPSAASPPIRLGLERALAARDAGPRRRQPDAAGRFQPDRPRGGRRRREITFYGSSFIADHTGAKVAEAGRDDEAVLDGDVRSRGRSRDRHSWGIFRDRRPDLYGPLLTLDGVTTGTR